MKKSLESEIPPFVSFRTKWADNWREKIAVRNLSTQISGNFKRSLDSFQTWDYETKKTFNILATLNRFVMSFEIMNFAKSFVFFCYEKRKMFHSCGEHNTFLSSAMLKACQERAQERSFLIFKGGKWKFLTLKLKGNYKRNCNLAYVYVNTCTPICENNKVFK